MSKPDYDAIIIGAGIGGLVCGCYLAKAGMKTMIVEKSPYPGGYCCSFTRQGYRFDACVHFLSTLRTEGKFHKILKNLGILDKIIIHKSEPSDIIVTPAHKIRLFEDINKTIAEFQRCFPKEKDNIAKFCNYIVSTPTIYFAQLRSKTFQELLDSYFLDPSLKAIFATFTLGLAGSPPHRISALVACLLLKEFILFDGGYYPEGGMQQFADVLMKSFVEAKGKIFLGKKVKKIILANGKADSIVLDNNESLAARYLISACDARQTFFELIGTEFLEKKFTQKIEKLTPSYSIFTVYLGIEHNFQLPAELKSSIWLVNSCNSNEIYSKMMECENIQLGMASPTMKDMLPGQKKQTLCLATSVPFISVKYWQNERNRQMLEDRLISMAETFLPDLLRHITLKFNATPLTLYKWTGNYAGAAYGWEGRPNQFGNPDISLATMFNNLYLSGHWNNRGSGVSSVANSGFEVAQIILHKENLA